jgi:putative endonuclease
MSQDAMSRLAQHNAGKTRSTKAFCPWEVVYSKEYPTRDEARKQERYLKSAAGRRWRSKNIKWPSSSTG